MSESDINAPGTRGIERHHAEALPAAEGGIVDCWNQVGVEGDGSCPQLREHIHCRNCPVFSRAGLSILNRAAPSAYRLECTENVAAKRKPSTGGTVPVVIFRLGAEWLALPARAFDEVTEQRPVHSIPHRRNGILLGLVNVRGGLLPCLSVAQLLSLDPGGLPAALRSGCGRLLVFAWEGSRLTFPADEVRGIHRLHPEEVTRPPQMTARPAATFVDGIFSWRQQPVGLLDADHLFSTLNRNLT